MVHVTQKDTKSSPTDGAGTDKADKGHRISIPSERAQQADIGELEVIHYKTGGDEESDKQSQKTASVKAGLVLEMSCGMKKPVLCICESKDTDQPCGNCAVDRCLCFHYLDRS